MMYVLRKRCPACGYEVKEISKHGGFDEREGFSTCPACQRDIVPIRVKSKHPESFDLNIIKQW